MIDNLDMDISTIKVWASSNSSIKKVYLYGSHVLGTANNNSDLDIAIEIEKRQSDSNKLATWISLKDKWVRELQSQLKIKLHLEWYEASETPTVQSGISRGHVIIYKKQEQQC